MFHIAVFRSIHDQETGEQSLHELGVDFERFPMGHTLIRNMTEEQFNKWIKPYNESQDEEISLVDLCNTEDESEARQIADCFWILCRLSRG